jgi:phospholipase/carboxylesterase
MNRLPICDAPPFIKKTTHANDCAGQATQLLACPPEQLEHAIFVPLHYERNYAYPLIVWLHGPGDDHGQLKRMMPRVSLRNYVAISPRGDAWRGGSRGSQQIPAGYDWPQTAAGIDAAMGRVIACIALARNRFNVSEHRVFLVGCDSGGTMAIRLGLLEPSRFAGVVSIGGPFPQGRNPLCGYPSARNLRVLLTCRNQSDSYSPSRACHDLRLMYAAGIPVEARQYDCETDFPLALFQDINEWLMRIVTSDRHGSAGGRAQPSLDEQSN